MFDVKRGLQRVPGGDYAGATAIASVMLGISFLMLLVVNLLQKWSRRHAT